MDSYLYYFTLPAPDIERSRRFYGELLGWSFDQGSQGLHITSTAQPGGLNAAPGEHTETAVWLAVADADTGAERVRALGGTAGEIVRYDSGDSVACTDDQGTRFHLSTPGYPDPPRYGDAHGDLFYFSLPVADGARAKRFYGELLGWSFDGEADQGGIHVANMVTEGGLGAGSEGHVPQLWFRVGDLDAAAAAVARLGGRADAPFEADEGVHVACVDDQGVAFNVTEAADGY